MSDIWPLQKDARRFYGAPGTNLVKITPAYQMTYAGKPIKTITLNKKCADSAARVFEAVAKLYSAKELTALGLNKFSGSFNNRPMRGGSQPSMHAYACAIDFDAERNQLKWGRNEARLAHDDCVPFWHAWEAEGWLSLGRVRNFDWMHVQAARLA